MSKETKPSALVVNDDAVILSDAGAMLQDAGLEGLTAMHADEALHLMGDDGHQLTVLFTDGETPGSMDGFELARHAADRWPALSIMVASGRRSPKAGELPEKATFIGKPFSVEGDHRHLHKVLTDDRKPDPLRQG